jgi:hypothetical protein
MRVTVIPADATVYVDGVSRAVQMPPVDANWHAIQWYGERGDVEVRIGAGFSVEDWSVVAPFAAAWEAAAPPAPPAPPVPPGQPAQGVEEM